MPRKKKHSSSAARNEAAPAASTAFMPACVLLWVALALLVVLQGGFYATPAAYVLVALSLAGAVLLAVRWRSCRSRGFSLQVPRVSLVALACCLCIAVVQLVSMLLVAPNATAATAVGMYFAVAGIAACCLLVAPGDRARLVRGVCWVGIGCSVLFLLMYAGVVFFPGAVEGTRLQGTFQYANSCGVFMGACALLCASSDGRRLRHLVTFPLSALLLTQSGGAVAATALCFACWAVVQLRGDAKDSAPGALDGAGRVSHAVLQGLLAAVALGVSLRAGSVWGVVAAAVLGAGACVLLSKLGEHSAFSSRRVAVVLLALVVAAACAVALFLMPARVHEAGQTLLERCVQVHDGLVLLAAHPVLGVGPDQWQFAYPLVQTAQYRAASIHCGVLQVALDGGLLAGVLWAVVIACGLVACARSHERGTCAAFALVALHSLIDFDLRFMAVVLLLFVLAHAGASPAGARCTSAQPTHAGEGQTRASAAHLFSALVAVCLLFGVVGPAFALVQDFGIARLRAYATTGNAQPAQAMVSDNAWLQDDPACQALYLQALCDGGRYDEAARWGTNRELALDQSVLYAAKALYECGQSERGAELLVNALAAQPANFPFFEAAQNFIDVYGLSHGQQAAYEDAVAQANALASCAMKLGLANQNLSLPAPARKQEHS